MADADTAAATDAPQMSSSAQEYLDSVKAGLDKDGNTQLDAQLQAKVADGTLNENDIFHAKMDVDATHHAFDLAHEAQHEQHVAAESGDFAGAQAQSQNAEYDLKVADNLGAESAHPTIDAQQDHQYYESQHLSTANNEAQIATANAETASSYASVGDTDHASQYAGVAEDHSQTAVDHGTLGDHGAVGSESHTDPAPAAAETSGETTSE